MTATGRPLRFAIVGCGVIGKVHARTLRGLAPRAELVAVADTAEERASALAAEHGVRALRSLEDVLRSPDVDAVTLATPSGLHGQQAVATLDAAKHVIVEKPLDITVAGARQVLAAERRSDRTAMVVSQRRYSPASRVVHEAARSGTFGHLTSGTASMAWWRSQAYYDSGDWRGSWALDGGGALMNQGTHVIDLFRWFLGDPVDVFAWAGCAAHERIEVEDTAVATVRFADEALGTIHGTTAAYPGVDRRVQVHGDRGSAVIENDQLVYYHAANGQAADLAYGAGGGLNQAAEVLPEQQDRPDPTAGPAAEEQVTSHTSQFVDFLDAVALARPPLVTVTEGAKTVALICAIYESARRGQVVTVQELAP